MASAQNKLKYLALLMLEALVLMSCTGNVVQHQYMSLGSEGWKKADTLVFDLLSDSSHLSSPLRMKVCIRITPSFPYRNLWLAMKFNLTSPDTTFVDTLCYEFSDSAGRMTGYGVTLLQYEQQVPSEKLYTSSKGQVQIYHLMKKEVIPELREVGIWAQ